MPKKEIICALWEGGEFFVYEKALCPFFQSIQIRSVLSKMSKKEICIGLENKKKSLQTHCNSVANILQTFKTLLPVLPFHFIWRPRKHIEANISRPLSIHQIQWRYFGNQKYFRQKKSRFFTNFLFDANFSIRSHPAWPDLTDHHFIKLGLEKKKNYKYFCEMLKTTWKQ